MLTTFIFLIVLAILIFVHELGHFLLARANGIRVDEFKIGFGPRIVSWSAGETEYGINLIPFGGFVKIHGENPDDDSTYGADASRSFVNKNRFQQVSVLAAGVIFNFLFACMLYIIVFAFGVTATKDGFEKYSSYFTNDRVMITFVEPGSPAEKSGLVMGDVIRAVQISKVQSQNFGAQVLDVAKIQTSTNGTSTNNILAISPEALTIQSIQDSINASASTSVLITYTRGNSTSTASVTPMTGLVKDKYAIGIAMNDVIDMKLPFLTAIYEGIHYTGVMIRDTTFGLFNFFANILQGNANFSDVSGPIGIAGIVGSAAVLGFKYLLMITALISINLGVINFIPFPALDGGRILFVAIEGIIRRRIPAKFSNAVNTIGFILLMILMVVVTYKDIAKLVK